eukprot:4449576-Alexandrium_andersonii.AAC.1
MVEESIASCQGNLQVDSRGHSAAERPVGSTIARLPFGARDPRRTARSPPKNVVSGVCYAGQIGSGRPREESVC